MNREDLSREWQTFIDEQDVVIEGLCRRVERAGKRTRHLRTVRRRLEAENVALRAELEQLKASIVSEGSSISAAPALS